MTNKSFNAAGRCGLASMILGAIFLSAILASPTVAQYQSASEIPAEVFAKLADVSELSLSPSGNYLAMLRPYKGRNALVVQPANSSVEGKSQFLPAPEPYTIGWFKWKTDDLLLVSIRFADVRDLVPTEETRLMSLDRKTFKTADIVKPGKKVNTTGSKLGGDALVAQLQDDVINFLWDDPDHILLSLDSDRDGEYEVRYLDIRDGKFKPRGNDFRGIQDWISDKQGVVRFGSGFDGKKFKMLYRPPDTDKLMNFENTQAYKDGFRLLQFDEDPRYIFMTGRSEHGTTMLVRYSMSTNEVVEILHNDPVHSVGGLINEPWTDRVIGYWYISDGVQQVYFDQSWKRRQATIDRALKGTVNRVVSSARDQPIFVVLSKSATESGMYWIYNEATKTIDPVLPQFPHFDPEFMATVSKVTYTARDGLKIPAYVTLPNGTDGKNLPTVLLPHGGPHSRDTQDFDYWAQFLASRGYAVLQPNFRGSSGFTAAFRAAGRHNWGLKMQDDLTDGVNWMIEEGIADKDRICIMGGSYGGYAALMGSIKTPDLFRCAISINGVSDLIAMIYEDKKYIGGSAWTQSVGDTGKDRKKLRLTSPRQQIEKIKIPILLVHTKDDRRVPYKHSVRMAKALKKAKKKYTYLEIKTGGHTLTTEKARQKTLAAVEKFLAKYLKK